MIRSCAVTVFVKKCHLLSCSLNDAFLRTSEVSYWMSVNRLKLTPDKMELL